MIKDKKILFLTIAILVELVAIVALVVLFLVTSPSESDDMSDEYENMYEYCQLYEDEKCDDYDEPLDPADSLAGVEVDNEVFDDVFRQTYAKIIKGEDIPYDNYTGFVVLSEYYYDVYQSEILSGDNNPIKYSASLRKVDTDILAYPHNVLRRIAIDVENEGCAVFDFSPDFSLLQKYDLAEGSCDELN